ncbi:MAG: glycosyltransferase family 2 protein [Acidobacteriia bacterium]|nr:glycosyltransferase family 2 protein [Terriglobia bacterium]
MPAPKQWYCSAPATTPVRVTVVIPTLNEAARIRAAVDALHWADEVIVTDGGSTDHTRGLASEAGARVIDARGGTIASQRNAGIAAARNLWILALDADERVPDQLRDEIAAVVDAPRHQAYRIRFRNFFLGREIRHGRWGNEFHVRLFQSDRRFQQRNVHETLEAVSDLGSLRSPLEHSPYRDLSHQIEKMARYARWGGEDLAVRGRRASGADLTFRPAWRFLREYIVYSGWKDGRAGLLLALLSACSALLKYAHLQAIEWESTAQAVPVEQCLPVPPALKEPPREALPILSDF